MTRDPNLLVGFETSDDAGVYRLDDERALVVTADFITPPLDDPLLFGEIGAANALSDVYAMGGRPLTCLSLVGFPTKKLGLDVLRGIIEGASNKIAEADAVLAGGHSVDDVEPKFGLAVTGLVHPEHIWSNKGARPGDRLVLTKPLGTGVLLNANLKGWVSEHDLEACVTQLRTLNRIPAEIAGRFHVHAATDVTGFGLACHALEMARASEVSMSLPAGELPVLSGALQMYERGVSTASNASNREMAAEHVRIEPSLPAWHESILFDPQTNGGLLFSLPGEESEALAEALRAAGHDGYVVGEVRPRDPSVSIRFV